MPPVKTVASSKDVDNDATAELPVLDVAAYEASLDEPLSSTDTWNIPVGSVSVNVAHGDVAEQPNGIPTLLPADPELAATGTHELPALSWDNKLIKATAMPPAAAAVTVRLPPSPPLIEDLRNALASAERRVEELQERARIADAERSAAIARATAENAQLREQLGQHLEVLHTARSKRSVREADLPGLEDELFARGDRIDSLQRELAAQAATLADVRAALDAGEQRAARLDAEVNNLRAALARRDAQLATLEADLAARQLRETELKSRLDEARASADPHAPQLRTELAGREEEIRNLKLELAHAQGNASEKNADLEVAEETIRNLELDLRDKSGKLEEASHTVEEWRAVIAESQRSILQRDGRIQQLEADLERRAAAAAADRSAETGEEVALEGPARVLIRTTGNTDFVHVLGRRTRIGRGSDNELVLDTKHISRYHAVLLAGPVNTTIEDLNSTNGVFVNGKRVARQVLKDGDRVTIGRTHFRFSVRT